MSEIQPFGASEWRRVSEAVHALARPDGVYVFNSLTLVGYLMSENEFNRFQSPDFAVRHADEYQALLRSGIVETPESRQEAVKRRFLAHRLGRSGAISAYRLVLIEGCNYACSYCFESEILPFNRKMTRRTLDTVLERIVEAHRHQGFSIHWFGGEPLLRWSEIDHGIRRLEQARLDGEIRGAAHSMTTHGGLVTEPIAAELADFGFDMFVSIDGPRRINDLNRIDKRGRSTYDAAVAGYAKLREAGANVGFLVTPNQQTLSELASSVRYLIDEFGARKIGINNPQPGKSGWNLDGKVLAEQLYEITELCHERGVHLVSPGQRILRALATREPHVQDCRGPNGDMAVSIDVDGKMSNCIVSWDDPTLHGGNADVTPKNLADSVRWKSESHLTHSCRGCVAEMVCGGPCALEAHLSGLNHDRCDFFIGFTELALTAKRGEGPRGNPAPCESAR
jgi:uncharacterized protein